MVRCGFQVHGEHARRLADSSAILMYSIGNAMPPLIVHWYGRIRIEGFLRELWTISKEEAPTTLTAYCNHPPTEYLYLLFLDIVSFNVYLEQKPAFRAYFSRLQTRAGQDYEKALARR